MLLAALSATRLNLQEDIASFVPASEEQKAELQHLRQQDEASRIVFLLSLKDTAACNADLLCDAIDSLSAFSSWQLMTAPDMQDLLRRRHEAYARLPYRLKSADYARLDSLLSPDTVAARMSALKGRLLMPLSGTMASAWTSDPLALFTPYLSSPWAEHFTLYDGYLFSRDLRLALAFLSSPYGGSETRHNALLVDSVSQVVHRVSVACPQVSVRVTGAPVIAVQNARQIKHDSLFAVLISLFLIFILLFTTLHSGRNLLLILLPIVFGGLFALGVMALIHPAMSLIVLGISSLMVGIAVNYPLHILVHRQYTASMRETLQQVLSPLIIGNLTTIGAFLTLIPLPSDALRDLGLFAALMLLGTILFTVVYLPHIPFFTPHFESFSFISRCLDRTSAFRLRPSWTLLTVLLLLTLVLGFFSTRVSFDSNLSHINYLTPQQRQDFALLQPLLSQPENAPLLSSDSLWTAFWDTHRDSTLACLSASAARLDFRPSAFQEFTDLISLPPSPPPAAAGSGALFTQLTQTLRSHFDYIGLLCSLLVFCFLWGSFRRFKYALIAFLPLVISWIWILGIMHLCHLSFNIINIILATFIFGQGDDYSIFITEGLIHRQQDSQLVRRYKNSIVLSALVMVIGMGALLVARHPALFSLGIVTVLGMAVVVLLTYLLPPLFFYMLDTLNSRQRRNL